MFRHMETRHGMRMEKWWECSLCGFEGEGIVLKGHFAKNHKTPVVLQLTSPIFQMLLFHHLLLPWIHHERKRRTLGWQVRTVVQ